MRLVGLVVATESDERESVERERDALGGDIGRGIHDLEMQMRRCGLTRIPKQSEHVAALHVLADPHSQTASLKVSIQGKSRRTNLQDDAVAGDVHERRRGRQSSRNVVGNAVAHRDHLAIGDGKDRFTESPKVLVSATVIMPRVSVGANLHPVDRKTLRKPDLSVHGNERSAMIGRIGRSRAGEPNASTHRRPENQGISAVDWRDKAVDDGRCGTRC